MATIAGALQALISLVTAGASGNEAEMRKLARQVGSWTNDAAVAGTTAISERGVVAARQKSRLVAARFTPAAGVTANAGDYFTLLVDKRAAAAPATPVNLLTLAVDTVTTDDLVAFAARDLFGLAAYITGASADFELEEGDVLTVEVTKTGASGLSFPIGTLNLYLEPRT